MSKPEWGTKRICQSCAVKFYDFGRTPIACPKCSAVFDPETLLKSRRNRPATPTKPSKPVAPTKPKVSDDVTDDADQPDDDDEDESIIEDASELGENDEETSKEIVPGKDKED